MGFLSGLLSPALGAVGNAILPGVGGVLGAGLGAALGGSSSGSSSPSGSAAIADPFSSQRPQYQQQLQQLMTPGSSFSSSDPSYQWRVSQGMESLNRGAAASGMLNSGNRLAALQDYGQQQASTEYQNQFSRLAQLSGANIGSPAVAAQLQTTNNAASSAYGQQLGGQLGTAFNNWMNKPVSVPQSSLPSLTMPSLNQTSFGF